MIETDPPEVTALLESFSGELAFDVGAHQGQTAVVLVRRFARVVAFEPLPSAYEALRKVPGVLARPEALSAVSGCVQFSCGEATVGQEKMTMLVTGDSLDWGTSSVRITVPCSTVDQMATEYGMPEFLKIDTEGHEVKVLAGASEALASSPGLLIEVHAEDHDKPIRALVGRELRTIRHPYHQAGEYLWRNHFWLTTPKG